MFSIVQRSSFSPAVKDIDLCSFSFALHVRPRVSGPWYAHMSPRYSPAVNTDDENILKSYPAKRTDCNSFLLEILLE